MSRQSNEWSCFNCIHHDKCQSEFQQRDIVFSEWDYCTSYEDIEDEEDVDTCEFGDW